MKAKEYLSQAFRLDQRINSKLEQVAVLRNMATKATASIHAERVSGTRQRSPIENAIVKLIDFEHEIDADIDRLVDFKREVIRFIGLVGEPEYRLVLEERHLNYKTWDEIAATMNYSYQHLHRIHAKALRKFQDVIECDRRK